MQRKPFDPSGTVRVLGFPYVVSVVESLPEADDGVEAGTISETDQEIRVLAGLAPDAAAETTLHEIVHAVEFGTGAEMEERQVCALARGLYAVCQDNPDYMRRLLFGDA